MEDYIYDLCIIGAGMFGSAAARHASANAGLKICLIGPDEPKVEEKKNRDIFGAHYDEGRITRMIDNDVPNHILSKNSINRYRELEKLSGIPFYYPVGVLWINKKDSSDAKKILQTSSLLNLPAVDLSYNDIFKRRFPYLKVRDDDQIVLDDMGSGHISPRKMVEAQKKVAKEQGCSIVNKVVEEVKPLQDGIHEIITEDGKILKAKRVLICTGAFINLKKFPVPKLKMSIQKETVAFLKLPFDEAQRLSAMPAIVYDRKEENIGVYILPPIKYPDDNYYLKIRHLDFEEGDLLTTLEEIKDWYLSKGDQVKIKNLTKLLVDMLPGLKYDFVPGATCATCENPTSYPYIDRISPTVTVAVVGNGRGAKYSDEIGRLGATLSLTGRWESEISHTFFQIVRDD